MLPDTVIRRLEALTAISKQGKRLNAGTLPDREHLQRNVKGEPDTWKLVRPVRREGDG
ncbi:hypothetical protein Krac_6748 [Ktedonobacter racemifer DSM 44963]|uniref:Uncharacterized protein n=1 Tax=Ktedonobacter racemifer DSM 44963 TaxID=485913 RepID=D6TNZ0_KTERA|nr:hypothetical protein Krac_6748 [Ktedonobacter racemifer DSM 44963]